MWNNKEYRAFIQRIVEEYHTVEQDVARVIDGEFNDRLNDCGLRKTQNVRMQILDDTLKACEYWLDDSFPTEVKAWHIASFRPAAIFFRILEKR